MVLVTGGNRGIGRVIAEQFRDAGYQVAATRRTGDVPDGVLAVDCDVTDPQQVDTAFSAVEAELGAVEILIANAGVTHDGLLARMGEQAWGEVIQTNLTGTFHLVKRACRAMTRARFGRIILISSVVALLGSAGQVNYAASKAGLVGMARSIARELGSRSITANVVAPGFIDTDMTAVLDQETVKSYQERIPLNRLGAASEVASAVRFLASDDASYITGAVLPVDGGLGMGH